MKIWRCTVCGWLHEGENPPEHCPRCGAPAEKFELVDLSLLELEEEDTAVPAIKELTAEDKKRIEPALFRISYGLFVVGSLSGGKINAQVCNTVFQITSAPMRVVIGVNKSNLTHEYIKDSGFFSVCVLGREHMDMVRNFGFRSGREADKFQGIDYTAGVTGAPIIDKCISYMECRVDPQLSVDVGTHTMFMGEVVEGGVKSSEEPMTYAFYRQAKNSAVKTGPAPAPVEAGKTAARQWRCKVCGYIHQGEEPPEVCPVCGAPKEEFELVKDDNTAEQPKGSVDAMKTNDNLMSAFAGESQANRKYLAFANKAEKEGYANVAKLFRAIAEAETIHALKHLEVAGKIGSTAENLTSAVEGEHYEFEKMYPEFLKVAEEEGNSNAVRTFKYAMEAEKVHGGLYHKAKVLVEGGKDFDMADMYLCPVCGWIGGDPLPDHCPICNALAKNFKKF